MTTYTSVAARILSFDTSNVGEGARDDQIADAEQALGIPIEGGYRLFLKQFGWAGIGHVELCGLGPDVPPHLDIVRVTQSERSEMEPRLQHRLLPFMNDGGGNLYCLDTATGKEPTVVFWDHTQASDQMPEVEAKDFVLWLNHMLDTIE